MTQEVIDAFHNVLFDQRFELCETNEVKEGHKTIPLKHHHYYLRAKDGVDYKTISEIKHLLEFLLVNHEQVLKDNKQSKLLINDIQKSIALLKDKGFSTDICIDMFTEDSKRAKMILEYNGESIFNNGMDEFSVLSAKSKLDKVAQFEAPLANGEAFGWKTSHLRVALETDTVWNSVSKLQVEFKLNWLNAIIHEQYLRYYDTLTGLMKRQKLVDDLVKHDKNSVLVMINIKDFTLLNERYGHEVCDTILKHIALALKEHFFGFDIYRAYGDRFVVIMPDKKEALKYVKPFMEVFKLFKHNDLDVVHPMIQKDMSIHLNLQASLTSLKNGTSTILEYANASINCAEVLRKEIVIFEDDVEAELNKELYWRDEIVSAITEGRIIPFFQPIYAADGKSILKYEALMRLEKDGNYILPGEFLSYATQGLYHFLTKMMIEESFKRVDSQTNLSVNISLYDILEADFLTYVVATASKYSFPLQNLTFELLENVDLTQHAQVLLDFAAEMREYKIKLAIDDFGTGYSNFKYLQTLQLDYLKIDGSLIKNIDSNSTDQKVVKSIIAFANAMNVRVIAEHIHNENVYNYIQDLGLNGLQGFYLGKPSKNII